MHFYIITYNGCIFNYIICVSILLLCNVSYIIISLFRAIIPFFFLFLFLIIFILYSCYSLYSKKFILEVNKPSLPIYLSFSLDIDTFSFVVNEYCM